MIFFSLFRRADMHFFLGGGGGLFIRPDYNAFFHYLNYERITMHFSLFRRADHNLFFII